MPTFSRSPRLCSQRTEAVAPAVQASPPLGAVTRTNGGSMVKFAGLVAARANPAGGFFQTTRSRAAAVASDSTGVTSVTLRADATTPAASAIGNEIGRAHV